MAISLSQYNIEKKKQSIADKLASQTQDLQQEPWWKTVGSVALPLLASLAMPGIGGALAGMAGQGGALASLLGTGKWATGIAKTVGTIGKGLQAAKKGQGILSTLGQIGTKAGYNMLTQKATGGLMGALDPKSAMDLNLTGKEKLYGGSALGKLRKEYRDAKEAEKQTGMSGAVLSAIASQGLGNIKDAFGVGLFNKAAPEGANMLEGLIGTGVEGAEDIAKTAEIMGGQASPLQQVASGQKMITDPNALARPSSLSLQTSPVNLTRDASLRSATIADKFAAEQFAAALPSLPGRDNLTQALLNYGGQIQPQYGPQALDPQFAPQGQTVSPWLGTENRAWDEIMRQYYNYEDIPEGWE